MTWKSNKILIISKKIFFDLPKSLSSNGSTITNQVEISNVFSNCHATTAGKTKVNINLSQKHFSNFLKTDIKTHINESEKPIPCLDSNKLIKPYSIRTKTLKLLKNGASSQMVYIFNTSFSTGFFPTILKVDKVLSVYKKDSYQTIVHFTYYPLMKKYLKNQSLQFLQQKTSSILYNLVLHSSISLFMP